MPRAGENRDVDSHFYHFGTSKEYLEVMTEEEVMPRITGAELVSFCAGLPYKYTPREGDGLGNLTYPPRLMASIFLSCVSIGEGSTLEYCHVREFTSVGSDCVVSSCSFRPHTTVPFGSILHTVAINSPTSGELQFVTVAFGIDDNIKASSSRAEAPERIKYFGAILEDTFTDADKIFSHCNDDESVSLWKARLFPSYPSMEKSSSRACELLNLIMDNRRTRKRCEVVDEGVGNLYSMADILRCKNVDEMLEFRSKLKRQIVASRRDQSALSTLYSE